MKRFYFQLKTNTPVNQIGGYGFSFYWVETCTTKKEVRQKYSSKSSRGSRVTEVYTEEQFIEKFGATKAEQIKKYYLA